MYLEEYVIIVVVYRLTELSEVGKEDSRVSRLIIVFTS